MKNSFFFCAGIYLLCFSFCKGQESTETVLSQIRAPSSPASKILGNEPNEITRPKSWNELEVSLFTDFLTEEGGINLNRLVNIEVSPYWLKKDRKITTESFILQEDPLENIKQNFTVSLATSNNLIVPDSIGQKNTSLAVGLRTMLWRGTKLEKGTLETRYRALQEDLKFTTRLLPVLMNVDCQNCTKEAFVDQFTTQLFIQRNQVFPSSLSETEKLETIDQLKVHLLANLDSMSTDGSSYRAYIDDLAENKYFSDLERNLLSLQEMIADRKGFKLEVAAALAIDFPTNETDFSTVPQYAFWVTPSYQPYDTGWIEFLGIVKYQGFHLDYYRSIVQQQEYQKNALDVGIKLVFKAQRFSFELEGVSRRERNFFTEDNLAFRERTESNSKYVARFNYRISDNLVLTYDFGSDFDLLGVSSNNLISQFALNYAIGAFKQKDIEYEN